MIALFLALQANLPHTFSGRTVPLNEGWKFVNLASQPSIWTGGDAVPTSPWRVVSVSSQEAAGENAIASKAFDGDPKTFWHTKWFEGAAPYPHELVIDLGVKTEAVGFRMLCRQTGPKNGQPNHVQVFLSNDRASWGTPIVADAVPNDLSLFQRAFSPTSGRFMRLVVADGHRGVEPFLAIAELGLIRNLDAKAKKDWESQYHIATVETGDARFDLKADSLEKIKMAELSGMKELAWKPATLPHAAWVRPLNKSEVWQGVTYYRRTLDIAPAELKQSIELTIGAAMQVSDLWLNGEHLATRRGGYLPLVANLTGKAKTQNDLLIRLDNSDNPLVPPGKPQQDLDFMYGAGIHREAKLEIQNPIHIVRSNSSDSTETAPIVTTDYVIGTTCRLNMVTSIRNDSDRIQVLKLVHELNVNFPTYSTVKVDPHSTKTAVDKMDVSDTILWSPSNPHLYQMKTRIMDSENRIVDSYTQKFGIRWINVSREHGFELNYKTLELIGTNRHQDYPWVGPALSRQANYRDAKLIKESGHNIVRLSHYPQSEEFLDACDELGILTIPCIAGWQFLNKDPRFENQVKQDIQELIQREASHPCVAWFETSLNETYPDNKTAQSWADAARSTLLGKNVLLAGDAKPGAPWDIAYNQWKDENYSRPQDAMPGKPGYIREYGDYEFGGTGSSSRVKIGQGIDKLLGETWNHVWSVNHLRPQLPWTMGYGTWEMFDHNVPYGEGTSDSGLCDLMRRQKPSFWFYKSQTERAPYVKLVADWQPGKATRRVVVFTNCDVAILSVNGRLLAQSRASMIGGTTKYEDAKPFDGSNTVHLIHPPIVFDAVGYESGALKVVAGRADGGEVADLIRTANTADHLKVWLDDLGYAVGRNDLVFVRAAVVDKNGVICPSESRKLRFTAKGIQIAGEGEVSCEMGVASILVRTPLTKSSGAIRVETPGLPTSQLIVQTP